MYIAYVTSVRYMYMYMWGGEVGYREKSGRVNISMIISRE